MTNQKTMLDAVLDYAARGWYVFPVKVYKGDKPNKAEKKPLTLHGQKDASNDPQQIQQWQTELAPLSWGVDCGRSGLVVIDIDNIESWSTIDPQIETLTARTGSGGYHLFYKAVDGVEIRNSVSKLAVGVDVRGAGGWVVVAPSAYIDGKSYQWINGAPLAEMPAAIVNALKPQPKAQQSVIMPIEHAQTSAQRIADKMIAKVAFAQEGTRNDTLYKSAFTVGGLVGAGLVDDSTTRELERAALAAGLGEHEVAHTLKSGINSGKAKPLTPTDRPRPTKPQPRIPPPSNNGHAEPTPQPMARNATPTDDELRDAWLARYPDTAHGLGEFKRYKAGVWDTVSDAQVKKEISEVIEQAKPLGIKPTGSKLSSVFALAQAKLHIESDVWDADANLLVCENGTLEMDTRTLRAHNKDDFCTGAVPYAYDPDAKAEWWLYAINTTVPDIEPFLQEFAGYCLTTDTRYELALWLYGEPGSGKSTILEGLRAMLGKRAGLLGLADIEKSRFGLSGISGKTLVVASEQPSMFVTTSHILNALISGEPLTVERKYYEPTQVIPRAKLAWAMNELPRIGESNNGLFRRVKVIHFPPLELSQRDPNVKANILLEGAGILNWALQGLDRLRARGGFEVPESIVTATEHFKDTNDVPKMFLMECCNLDQDQRAQAQLLYNAYSQWCKDNGHKPMNSTRLAKEWARLGLTRTQINGKNFWQGVGIQAAV